MKKMILCFLFLGFTISIVYGQQAFYDVSAGNGNGIRFWQGAPPANGTWSIQMGNQYENLYGPVSDYSIKTSMDGTPGRGWVWGVSGNTPVAAINNQGNMQIAGKFVASVFSVGTSMNSKKIALWDDPSNFYGFGIQSGQVRLQTGVGGRFSYFCGDTNEIFTIKGTGEVGIGTTSPDAKLTVNGTIHATEVKVTTTVPGPDYVFEKSYDLPSLNEVESYIDENKHLPEVPSAKEMAKNGINLSEMNMLLLKKVEELTLYLIEQKKQIENLKSEISTIKAK